jgi:hypothetical protein
VRNAKGIPTKYRVAELVANVTARLDGSINDWPANIQDQIYMALERQSHRSRVNFSIIQSYSDVDVDSGPYVHVVAVCLEIEH